MTTDFTPPQDRPDEPPVDEAPANPWAPLEERGFRPDQFQPDEIVNGAQWWKAFNHRDYRDAALSQALRSYGFPEDLSPRELKEMAMQARQEPDPWQQVMGEPQYEDQYGQPQTSYVDPNAIQQAVDAQVQRHISEFEQRQAQQAQQHAYEQEFTRELDRASGAHDFGGDEKLWLASTASQLRQSMPYASTQEIMDTAAKQIDAAITRRIQSMSTRQQETPAAPLPAGGALPSDQQVPQNAEQAREAARRFFIN
jgi:hypothetical protein